MGWQRRLPTARSSAVLIAALLLACDAAKPRSLPSAQSAEGVAVDELALARASDVRLDADALARVVASARTDPHPDLASLLVARDGQLVIEEYFNGAARELPLDVRSVAKSITGTLVGIAVREGAIVDLDARVRAYFPSDVARGSTALKADLTLRHLLEMRSGLDADDWWSRPDSPGIEAKLEAAADRTRFALELPLAAAPGQRWQYSSVNTLLLGRVLSNATHQDLEAYARAKLFEPLDFGAYAWQRDPSGDIVPQGNLSLRARDLLKVGLLFENGGRWRDRELVSPAWIEQATRSRSALPEDASTGLGELYRGYGYHWWTSEELTPLGVRSCYFASGNGGQRLYVVPDLRLVAVVTSSAYNQARAHRRSHALFRAVLATVQTD